VTSQPTGGFRISNASGLTVTSFKRLSKFDMPYNFNIVQTPMTQIVSMLAVVQVLEVRIPNAEKEFHTHREGRLGSG